MASSSLSSSTTPPPPPMSSMSLPYRGLPLGNGGDIDRRSSAHHAPPSPVSPISARPPMEPTPVSKNNTHTPLHPALPTPPITPLKPALSETSRVDSIDLERDAALLLPVTPRTFAADLQVGVVLGEGQWARVVYGWFGGTTACAVKVPRKTKKGEAADVLRHEAQVLTLLHRDDPHAASRHLLAFYGWEPATRAIILEYAPSTLEALVQAYPPGTPLSTDPIIGTLPFLALARSLIASLAWIHTQGVIHGDIKPRNILCHSVESVRIGDFSSARLVGDVEPWLGDTCTTAYAAPELLQSFRSGGASSSTRGGGVPSLAADHWGLAATLLFAGTGEEPYADIPHALGRLAEATRGTAWEHMRNGGNISRVRERGVLWCVLNGILLRRDETARWSLCEWGAVVEDISRGWLQDGSRDEDSCMLE